MKPCKDGEHCFHETKLRKQIYCCKCSWPNVGTVSRRDLLVWSTVGTVAVVTGRWFEAQDSEAREPGNAVASRYFQEQDREQIKRLEEVIKKAQAELAMIRHRRFFS